MPLDLQSLLQAMQQGGQNGFPAPLANNAYAPQVPNMPQAPFNLASLGQVPLQGAVHLPGKPAPTLGPALGSLPTDPSNMPVTSPSPAQGYDAAGNLVIHQPAQASPFGGGQHGPLMNILMALLKGGLSGGFGQSR